MSKLDTILDFEKVDIAKVSPNPWNPNKQNDAEFQALKLSIKERGFVSPIHVRDMGDGNFQIIGGFHRYRAWKDLGNEHIWIINEGPLTDVEAKMRGLQDNLHGENVPIDLARLIVSMEQDGMTLQQIAKRMGRPTEYINDVKELVNLEPDSKQLKETIDRPHVVHLTFYTDPEPLERSALIVEAVTKAAEKLGAKNIHTETKPNKNRESVSILDFAYTEPQKQVIEAALKLVMDANEGTNRNRALELICADYMAGNTASGETNKKGGDSNAKPVHEKGSQASGQKAGSKENSSQGESQSKKQGK